MNGSNHYYPHLVDYNDHREMTRFERRAINELCSIKTAAWAIWWILFGTVALVSITIMVKL